MNPAIAGPMWKPSRTERKIQQRKTRLERIGAENSNKSDVRKRDKFCRFPMCGCRRLRLRCEVSHVTHKGMGGNPRGDRSVASEMVLLCFHRHQDGIVSRHKGTLRAKYLTSQGFNGPVAWEVPRSVLRAAKVFAGGRRSDWVELARESSIGIFEPFEGWQYDVLHALGKMEL